MSKSPNEPENAAPKASVRTEQGHKPPRESDQNKTGWTPPARSKSTSLLTQALSTNYEADEIAANTNPLNDFYTAFPDSQQTYFASQDAQQHNGMSAGEGAQTTANKMATVSSSSAGNLRTTVSLGTTPTSSSTAINFHDMNSVNSLLSGHRELLNKARGRGTSLERTEKEKRIQELPKGPYSTNPGDTALGAPSPQGSTTPEPISTTAPTEGVRARYRSWRDARPGMAAEKAWSIGEQGSDDSGQVEKSITEALTGVEPNSRSRKASHSLRFFKEGLPEDKSKRKDSKTKGPLKDGLSCGKSLSSLGNGNSKQRQESHTRDHFNAQTLNHPTDGQNRGQPPVGRGRPSSKDEHQIVNPTEGLAAEKGYFDLSPKVETVSDQQAKAMPAQLLAEIRKNHNLTPGAAKGSSFSRSIPVTASERSKDDGRPEDLTGSLPTRDDDNSDGEELSQVKSAEEEDDSGEEQISSALFVPHQTPHESPEREIALPGSSSRPKLKDVRQSEVSNSQQWLEEHEVPSRDVDKKYISQEVKSRPLPSPVKLPSPLIEQETLFPDVPGSPDVDRESHDEGGYSTKSEDAGSTDDQDSDTTPTGSLKRRNKVLDDYPQHLHDHQQKAQQPVEAIELIPYRHQVGGHTTMWRFSKRAVCKQLNNRENEFYEKVERYHPNLVKFLPRYIGVLNVTFEKQTRRKATKKDGVDSTERQKNAQGDVEEQSKADTPGYSAVNGTSNGQPEQKRVISQSLHSSSVPIPTVTFADNRHIIPKSFLRPRRYLVDPQHRSKCDSAAISASQRSHNQAQPPLPDGEFTFRKDGPTFEDKTRPRPTLEDKHSDSWGSTLINRDLRNKVFDEAFLQQPIPIHHHRKPASQRRSLPNRLGISLRASNSESSLKAAQQSQAAAASSQPPEESMRRRAMKTAAEQKHGLTPLTPANPPTEAASEVQEGETGFDEKAGTSAPEPELPHEGDTQKGKRQRRYSSGGLRRKPSEVADDRGNLKYFEEADDAGYKGDVEEEVFAMDIGPSQTSSLPLRTAQNGQGPMIGAAKDDVEVAKPEMSKEIVTGIMLPPSRDEPTEATNQIDLPRPANPKEAQTQQGSRVEYFLLLEDLTTGMKRPCIMDLKMGTRQYGVEVNEKKQKSQRQKCAATTSKELGVRVCGLQVWDVKTQTYVFQDKYFGRDLKVGREFQNALMRFLYDGVDYSSVLRHIPTILSKLSQLEVIIRGLAGYRFYAASLLMFYDGDTGDDYESDSVATEKDMGHKRREIDFKIADFANCVVKETTRPTNPACPPRHPELPDLGFLRGLKSLRKYFLAIQEEIRQKEMGFTKEQINNVNGDLGFDGSEDDEGVISY